MSCICGGLTKSDLADEFGQVIEFKHKPDDILAIPFKLYLNRLQLEYIPLTVEDEDDEDDEDAPRIYTADLNNFKYDKERNYRIVFNNKDYRVIVRITRPDDGSAKGREVPPQSAELRVYKKRWFWSNRRIETWYVWACAAKPEPFVPNPIGMGFPVN